MIFVTVGSHMPFDRLILAVDRWAGLSARNDVFAQIGPSEVHPKNIAWTKNLKPLEFRDYMCNASVIVAHAGMGTIITALELNKPILVMPRRGDLRETRNDHQIATAKHLERLNRVAVAYDTDELESKLDHLADIKPGLQIAHKASSELLDRLRLFIHSF